MNLDPDKLTIEECKVMGLWPPQDNMGVAIAPYIRRMKNDVTILDIGVGKGESIVYLAENCSNIEKIFGLIHDNTYDDLLSKNILGIPQIHRVYNGQEVDVVLVNMKSDTTIKLFSQYYDKVKPGGYFVGDQHTETYVKEILSQFRRENKIGNPIQIINKTIWMWKK